MSKGEPEATASSRARRWRDDPAFVSLALFATGLVLMLALTVYGQAYARQGQYLQAHSSEDLMQTLSLLDLREHPVRSLFVLHVQPPFLDTLRALLARLWPDVGPGVLVRQVDRALYLIWAMAYAGIAVVVFRWLNALLRSTRLAALAAALFLLHPAAIYYGTLLDSTTLTTLAVLTLCYALWATPGRGALTAVGGAYLFLFFLRSIFQWPVLVVLVAALVLRRVPWRRVAVFAVVCGLAVGAYMVKQYLVFGWTGTSSLGGSNCLHALGEEPEIGLTTRATVPLGPLLSRTPFDAYPPALTRESKITGAHNFNHVADLDNERRLLRRCAEEIVRQPLRKTLAAYAVNVGFYLQPSSQFYEQPHALVDRLPWRGVYDWVFSGYRLIALLVTSIVAWAWRRPRAELLSGLGLALPLLLIGLVSVTFERGENMRFKYFIEPVLYVFVVSRIAALVGKRRRPA